MGIEYEVEASKASTLSSNQGFDRPGQLIPMRTTLETTARETLLDVYITYVPAKLASIVLDVVRKLAPNDGGLDLQHLRRFAKHENLPEHLRLSLKSAGLNIENGGLFVIVGSTNILPQETVLNGLSKTLTNPFVATIQIPLLAPTTADQAKIMSLKYWPTVYKKSNPFGPHPSLVSRTADELAGDVQKWMALAVTVAEQTKAKGFGEAFGVVVVERRNGVARPIAVAGDARWKDWHGGEKSAGNVTAHAAMRAIGMISKGLRNREISDVSTPEELGERDALEIFRDKPILDLEHKYNDTSGNEHGYLCFDLEIYCTHEPCIMCAMAIVHSRFGRLVFAKRMRETGGICAEEDGLGCGLWWRKELNWTMLAWQYADGDAHNDNQDENSMLHV